MPNEKKDSETRGQYNNLEKRRKLLKASAAVPLIVTLNPNAMAASASAIGACATRLEDINPPQKDCGINALCGDKDEWVSTTYTELPKTYSVTPLGYRKIAIPGSTISQQKAAARDALRGGSNALAGITYRCDYTKKVYKVGNDWYSQYGKYRIENADGTYTDATDDDVCSKGEFVDALVMFEKYSNGEPGVVPRVKGVWPKVRKNKNTQGLTKSCYATFPNTNNSVISS